MVPKLASLYHLLPHCEQRRTLGLHSPTAHIALCRSDLVREAWPHVGDDSAGRKSDLSVKKQKRWYFSDLNHLGVDHALSVTERLER